MKDFRIEQWLNTEGVKFEYVSCLALTGIDRVKSLRNQARLGKPLDDDTILAYSLAMKEGTQFPAIVVYRDKGNYVLIGGNHRIAAADLADRTQLDAYCVLTSDLKILDRLTRTANLHEGRRLTYEESLEQAVYLVMAGNYSQVDAARVMGITVSRLGERLRIDAAKQRAQRLALDVRRIPDSSMERLMAISADPVYARASALVAKGALPGDTVSDMVKEVRTARSELEQLSVVAQWEQREDVIARIAESRNGSISSVRHAPHRLMLRELKTVETYLDRYTTKESAGFTSSLDEALLQDLITRLIQKLVRFRRGNTNGNAAPSA